MTSSDHVYDIDRRHFFVACATAACAFATTGCASLATRPVTTANGVVRLTFADHPDLARPRGSVRILPTGERDPVYVLALGDNRFAAVSPICTHRGCTVELQDEHLVCPCHGSAYDRSGAVLRGPAERPLRRFRVRVEPGAIEIALKEPA